MTMKKWLSLLLALVLVVGCMPAAALAAEELTNRETGLELEEVLEETQEPSGGIPEHPETEATEETESTEETDPTEEATQEPEPTEEPTEEPTQAPTEEPEPTEAPTEGVEQAPVNSQEALLAAIDAADSGTTITLEGNITLTRKLVIDKSITIDGSGFTITGQPDNQEIGIEIQSGTFGLRNVTLENFGSNVAGTNGAAVIRVPATASSATVLKAENVNIQNFARSAYDIRSGSFAISGGSITCSNGVAGDSNTKLTKGILVGLGTNKVSGIISGVTITNAVSNYADWNTAAIEIYNNGEVSITGCSISRVKNGIHVDNYWGAAGQDVSVTIRDTQVDATTDAVKLYSTYSGKGGVANANVLVESGVFKGAVRYVGKTEKDTITVTGGTFSADPTQHLPEGYAVRESEEGYVVYQVADNDTSVEVVPEEDGSALVSEEAMNDAISSAVSGGNPQVTIQVTGDPEAQRVSVSIPTGSLDALAAQENAALTITASAGQVTFDQDALNTIAQEAAGQNVTLELAPASGLTQEQQDIIGDNVAIDLTLRLGDTLISQFNGEAKVTVPFVLAGDKDAADVEVYYVAEDGELTKCASRYADGLVEFTTRHFSTYMVTYAEELPEETVPPTTEETVPPTTEDTVPPTTDEPSTEAPTTEGTKDPNGPAQTGDTTPVALLLGLMITGVAGVAFSLVYSKKRSV